MVGISYFAMTQLAAAVMRPTHLKAIFPLAVSDDLYAVTYHNGLLSSGFISAWITAIGVLAAKGSDFWRGEGFQLLRRLFTLPQIHKRLEHANGEAINVILNQFLHAHYDKEPFGRLRQEMFIEHPTRDAFWDDRDNLARLNQVNILPVTPAA